MRQSREAKAESHKNIVAVASRLFRERGAEGASVADVMQAAGMTHGGFYKHFGSKEELLGAAVEQAFDTFGTELEAGGEKPKAAAQAFVEKYLSKGHLANPGLGCPIAALGIEAGRMGGAVVQSFAEGVGRMLSTLETQIGGPKRTARQRAEVLLATLVGAVVMARASGKASVSRDVQVACDAFARAPREGGA